MRSAQRGNFSYFSSNLRGQTAITNRISKAGERNLSVEEAAPSTDLFIATVQKKHRHTLGLHHLNIGA